MELGFALGMVEKSLAENRLVKRCDSILPTNVRKYCYFFTFLLHQRKNLQQRIMCYELEWIEMKSKEHKMNI